MLGTLETPETAREHSRLFRETPSPRAREIIQTPIWKQAVTLRLTEAMYGGGKKLNAILFPRASRKVSTYDSDITLSLITEEEAVKCERRAEALVVEEDGFTRNDAYASILREGPPSEEQIVVEEQFRRILLKLVDSMEQKDWGACDTALAHIQQMIAVLDGERRQEIARVFVADTLQHLMETLLDEAVKMLDIDRALGFLHLIHSTLYFRPRAYARTVDSMVKDKRFMAGLARNFLTHIASPTYNDLWRRCEQYGFDMPALKKRIRAQCIPELAALLTARKGTDHFFRYLDFSVRQEIFTEDELSSLGSLRTAVLEHAQFLLGDRDAFRTFRDHCTNAKVFSAGELTAHPVIRKAAEEMLVARFEGGNDIDALLEMAAAFANLQIMHYDEALNLPALKDMAADNLERIFNANMLTDNPSLQERTYISVVGKYVDAKIGTRSYFDNLPAIKYARHNAAQRIKNDS